MMCHLQAMVVEYTTLTTIGGHIVRTATLAEVHYSMGTQSVITQPLTNERLQSIWTFDGVYYDRYTIKGYHEASGDECAELRCFRQ